MELTDNDVNRMSKVLRHRLRNFASGIKNAVVLLEKELDQKLSAADKEYFPLLQNECDELVALTDRLTLALEDARGDEAPAAVKDVLSDMAVKLKKSFPLLTLDVRHNGDHACDCLVKSRNLLATALWEVAVNAVEANPRGCVEIVCSRPGEMCLIGVSDSGAGIAQDISGQIFDPFFTSRPRKLGVGLWIARKCVEALGGRLEVGAPQKTGALINVLLPC